MKSIKVKKVEYMIIYFHSRLLNYDIYHIISLTHVVFLTASFSVFLKNKHGVTI